ncbi:MAG TPA: FeoB-associated Cys-rich membrane protein [Pedobacter sp.]|jgi:hypothetical protein
MGVQEVLLGLLFIAALVYIAQIIRKNFQSKKACSSGCEKCAVDFSDIDIKKNP